MFPFLPKVKWFLMLRKRITQPYNYRAFYNWWRQRKHKQLTKDETHLHMAWEQDYHLQDPGRLALFDEYLEMSKSAFNFITILQFIQAKSNSSRPIWLCDPVCGRLSVGSSVCITQQHCRNSAGCLQDGYAIETTSGGTCRGYWSMVRDSEDYYLHRCCVKCKNVWIFFFNIYY